MLGLAACSFLCVVAIIVVLARADARGRAAGIDLPPRPPVVTLLAWAALALWVATLTLGVIAVGRAV